MEILLATNNAHKVQEIMEILDGVPHNLKSLGDLPSMGEPVEDGATYQENAAKKALYYHKATGLATLADDSGIEIDAFGGAPGIHSARFIDPAMSFAERNRIVLERLKGVPMEDRGARFRCLCVFVKNEREIMVEEGILEGKIGFEIKGGHGFGYDPIFLLPDKGLHLAEVEPDEKNRISHRARAFVKMREHMEA